MHERKKLVLLGLSLVLIMFLGLVSRGNMVFLDANRRSINVDGVVFSHDKYSNFYAKTKNGDFKLKLMNLSYMVFNFKTRNKVGFTGFYSALDLLEIFRALYRNVKHYGFNISLINSFGLLSTLAYYTGNKSLTSEAEKVWRHIKTNYLYTSPIRIYSNGSHVFYRVPYFARINSTNNHTNFYSQFLGLYYLWKATGNAAYLTDLKKSFYYEETKLVNDTTVVYLYGYYYNIVWNPFAHHKNSSYDPPYGTPILRFFWDSSCVNSYHYWTWESAITTLFNIAVDIGIFPEKLYAKVFHDLFYVLWSDKYKMIYEAWNPINNYTKSIFGEGKTRIHAYNLGAFIRASKYYPDIKEKLKILINTMLDYWVDSRKMYRYNPATVSTFEQFMMTIPNALHQLNSSSELIRERNIEAILTYLVSGVLKRPTAWPLTSDYYGILHAKTVTGEWNENDSGSPEYVNVKNTHEGYMTALYLLTNYGLEQFYFNPHVFSLISSLKKFIGPDGFYYTHYILHSGLKYIDLSPFSPSIASYYSQFYEIELGETWNYLFKYSYRWGMFPIYFKEVKDGNETSIIFIIKDIIVNKRSLMFIPFYENIADKLPVFNAKMILANGTDYTNKTVIFADNVISFSKIPRDKVYIHNLTIIYSNQKQYISDSDGDLLTDYWETLNTFNPMDNDTNNNGLLDTYEALYNLKTIDLNSDIDGDNMPTKYEQYFLTSPYSNDTDMDGLTDGFEIAFNLNPMDIDTDNDGVKDGDELNWNLDPRDRYTQYNQTSRVNCKSDYYWYTIIEKKGQWSQEKEIQYEKSLDYDNDGISNYEEFNTGSDIFKKTNLFLKIIYPTNNTYINSSEVTIHWFSINTTSNTIFIVYLDGNRIYEGKQNKIKVIGLNDGEHTVKIEMLINNNTILQKTINFYVDTTPPNIQVIGIENKTIIKENNLTIQLNISDNLSGISKILIKLNNKPWTQVNQTTIEIKKKKKKTNTLYIKAIDKAGNAATIKIILILETPSDKQPIIIATITITTTILVTTTIYIKKKHHKPKNRNQR